jgi:hypothetical protein
LYLKADKYIKDDKNHMSSLEIWAEEMTTFPHVFAAPSKWLAFTPTNVPGERLFSHSSRIKTNLRSSLAPGSFKSLLLMFENRRFVFNET